MRPHAYAAFNRSAIDQEFCDFGSSSSVGKLFQMQSWHLRVDKYLILVSFGAVISLFFNYFIFASIFSSNGKQNMKMTTQQEGKNEMLDEKTLINSQEECSLKGLLFARE